MSSTTSDAARRAANAPAPPMPQQQQPRPGSDAELQPKADHGEESYHGRGRLTGKTALITGGDSGIGRAAAIAFAKEGADVIIAHLPEEERDAADTMRHVERAGRKAISVPGDVQDEGYCRALVDRAFGEFGKLDVLVNNAAFQAVRQKITDIPPDEFEHTFRTNVFGTFYLCRAALPRMSTGGSIINTASIEAFTPEPYLLAYAATKAAIVNLTKSLAKLAGKQGVRVNAVAPGPVWTPLIPSTMPPEHVKEFGKSTVFGRPAQPVELAPVFVLLASDEGSYITGETYGVTGGRMPV